MLHRLLIAIGVPLLAGPAVAQVASLPASHHRRRDRLPVMTPLNGPAAMGVTLAFFGVGTAATQAAPDGWTPPIIAASAPRRHGDHGASPKADV